MKSKIKMLNFRLETANDEKVDLLSKNDQIMRKFSLMRKEMNSIQNSEKDNYIITKQIYSSLLQLLMQENHRTNKSKMILDMLSL